MSEELFVEKPLLDQLQAMGWQVIVHAKGIPQDPSFSLRTSFREVLLKNTFIAAVKKINPLVNSEGRKKSDESWLTDAQCEQLFNDLSHFDTPNLLEANETFLERLYKWQVDANEHTGELEPTVNIIDFYDWQANTFTAINQFRIDPPGGVKPFIIPDVVLFVNGLPLVVIECKDTNSFTSDAMHEAIKQLHRYADLREETIAAGLKEGEQKLFWTNQLMIATYGDDCKYGTITSSEDYYFQWKTIYPDEDSAGYIHPTINKHRSQERLVQGMLHPDVALEALKEGWQQKRFSADELMQLAKACRIASVIRPYFEMLVV